MAKNWYKLKNQINWYTIIIAILLFYAMIITIMFTDKVSEKAPPTVITGTVANVTENAAGFNRWVTIKVSNGNVVTVYDHNTNFLRGVQPGDFVSVEIEEKEIGYKVIGVVYE